MRCRLGQPEEMRTLRLKRHTLSVSMYIKLNYRHSLLGLACEYISGVISPANPSA
jgi:hypothetical protein